MTTEQGLIPAGRGKHRCWWCGTDPLYVEYHDLEWGRPVFEDKKLFEKICLEGFQAGLSWLTILRKRENFRDAFAGFELERVAKFGSRDINKLLRNEGIVRHRGKIESTINNAKHAIKLVDEFSSLSDYFWRFRAENETTLETKSQIVSVTPESNALSKDLKRRGWSFVGPTTCYAFMQAMGIVNDHLVGCHVRKEVQRLRPDAV